MPTPPTTSSTVAPIDVAATLRRHLSADGSFALPADGFGGTILDALFRTFLADGTLSLSHASISGTAQQASLTGTGGGTLAGTTVQADFTRSGDGAAVALSLTATLQPGWAWSMAFPDLAGTITDHLSPSQGALVLTSDETGGVTPTSLVFHGTVQIASAFSSYGWLLGPLTSVTLGGAITMTDDGQPLLSLSATPGGNFTLGTLKDLPIAFRLISQSHAVVISQPGQPVSTSPGLEAWFQLDSSLSLPVGPGVSVPLSMRIAPDQRAAQIDADLTQLTGVGLTAFAALVGGADLSGALPTGAPFGINTVFPQVGLSFIITMPTSGLPKLAMVAIDAQLPTGTQWTIMPGLSAKAVKLSIGVADPASSPSVHGGLYGTLVLGTASPPVLLDINAQVAGGALSLGGTLADDSTIDLNALAAIWLSDTGWLPSAQVTGLDIGLGYDNGAVNADFQTGISTDWTIPVGPASLTVTGLSASLAYAQSAMTGSLGGQMTVGPAQLDVSCALPGQLRIKGSFDDFTLSQLLHALCDVPVTLPGGFDLTFRDLSVLIQAGRDGLDFQCATHLAPVGDVAFSTTKAGGRWGFALGLGVTAGELSTLPGLSGLKLFEDTFGFDSAVLVVCSQSVPDFSFPGLDQFDNPSITGHAVTIPAQADGLQTGFNFYAQSDLTKPAMTRALAKLLGLNTLGVTLAIGTDPATQSRLSVSVHGNLNGALPLTGTLSIQNPGGVLTAMLMATVPATIQGQQLVFDVGLAVAASGAALVFGDAKGTIDFHIAKLSNLALEVGISVEGIPSLGVAAQVDTHTFDSAIAVFFDSANPAQSMFLGALSNLSLADVATTLTGTVGETVPQPLLDALGQVAISGTLSKSVANGQTLADALDNRDAAAISAALNSVGITVPSSDTQLFAVTMTAGQSWSLTDLSTQRHYLLTRSGAAVAVQLEAQIYCAPQTTQLANLPPYPQGFFVNGQVSFFGLTLTATIDIQPNNGLSVDAAMSPIQLLGGQFLSITGSGGNGGPALSLSTYTNRAQTDPAKVPPHFFLSGSASLLGVSASSIQVNVSATGLSFTFSTSLGPASYALSASVSGLTQASLSGMATIQVGSLDLGPLGSLPVNSWVGLSVTAGLAGDTVSGSASGQISLLGTNFPLHFTVNTSDSNLSNLPPLIIGTLTTQVRNFLSGNVGAFLNAVKNNLLQGFQDCEAVGRALATVFGQQPSVVADEAKNVLQYGVNQVAGALKGAGAGPQQIGEILSGLGYAAGDIANALSQWFSGIHADFGLSHVDQTITPHGDTSTPHVDHSTFLGHVDVGGHVDVPSVHTDTSVHVDT